MAYISKDPLFSANYVPKKKITTRTPRDAKPIMQYFQGEVNDEGEPDGV